MRLEPIPRPSLPAPLPRFAIQELPPIDGWSDLHPTGINSNGDVVGWYIDCIPSIGRDCANATPLSFLYDAATGTMRQVLVAGEGDAEVMGISDDQTAAVSVWASETAGYRWRNGAANRLADLANRPDPVTQVTRTNAGGVMVGFSEATDYSMHAVLWEGTTADDLGLGQAYGVSPSGRVAGCSYPDGNAQVYENGGAWVLGTLGGNGSCAFGINDQGRVVGFSWIAVAAGQQPQMHGFVYELPDGPMRDIAPERMSALRQVNDTGDAVGSYVDENSDPAGAILWRNGAVIDLTSAVGDASWSLIDAVDINAKGQIVGEGLHDGNRRGFIVTPE